MSREQDSVAVLRGLKADLRAGMPKGAPVREYGRPEEYAALDAAIAALTREAAPQASGGDGWQRMTDEARAIQLRHLDNHQGDVYHAMQHLAVCFGYRDTRPLTQPIATTDSAIQSQQGATGGAESRQNRATYYESRHAVDAAMVDRATVAFVACDRPLIADGIRAALEAALAHPQAAGSAPGEALQPQRSHGSMTTPEWIRNGPQPTNSAGSVASGAGSAPVGVDDTARLDWLLARCTVDWSGVSIPCGLSRAGDPAASRAAIDAALEKERAE